MNKKLITLVFLTMLGTFAFAQIHVGFYAGVTKPLGDFGKTMSFDNATDLPNISKWALGSEKGTYGFAKTGINLGFNVTYELASVEGLSILGGLDFFYNNSNDDIDNYFQLIQKASVVASIDLAKSVTSTTPQYMNFPLLFGVDYEHFFTSSFGVFAQAAIGPNFRSITDCKITEEYTLSHESTLGGNTVAYSKVESTNEYDMAVTFAIKAGAGIIAWRYVTFGVDYCWLGSAKIKGKQSVKLDGRDYSSLWFEDTHFESDNAFSCSELVFKMGLRF